MQTARPQLPLTCRLTHSNTRTNALRSLLTIFVIAVLAQTTLAQETDQKQAPQADQPVTAALIDGKGPDWQSLGFDDFLNVNCKDDTWSKVDDLIVCNGNCNGGFRSKESYQNFEMVMEWKHLKRSGNSGVFVWCPKEVLDNLKPGALPQGIEIQILDHGYAEDWEKSKGKPSDWFTTDGDVFPVGIASMKPFAPAAPNGKRSFPSAKHSKGVGQWNHYYIRAINGEVRLWVNGHEVSGGNECKPASGFIVLEAESAPIEFRNIRVRKLK
ncbi:MAG: DUF1080 domain-containing protein [Planctomycetota bacterium]